MHTAWFARTVSVSLLSFAFSATSAQAGVPDQEAEMKAAVAALQEAAQPGPVDIPLGGQATLKLPEGYAYVPQKEANRLLNAMGNGDDPTRLGLILPPEGDSFVVPRYIPAGYIKDDEAADWNADDLLDSLTEGTEETNKERAARGLPQMEIVGWNQKPTYDKASHRLVWAIETADKGVAEAGHGANYNTYVLGREGYLSMNLVSDFGTLGANKPHVANLLARTSFDDGKRYADFDETTDKVAEYGIAALVTGVAAKKLGLFAVIAAFVAKFAKLFAIAGFALVAGLGKFFKRDKTN